ncbi:condensation domain-containing protein [Kutzneria sp. NPDC052558]|uniref:condensation domain-containing protein n=1 Tax=Kutzneria sp. NPDC052558 TaxID=3364121 RepID=UPI0037CBD488
MGLTWPASVFQHTLMATDQLLPGGSTGPHMTMSVAARITGPLDLALLDQAYDDLVARNDVLRTTMVQVDGGYLQQVHPHQPVHLDKTDGHGATAGQLADEWSRTPVPSTAAPLIRGHVAQLDDGDHVVGLILHHLHTDPRSLQLAIAELGRLYTARVEGRTEPAPAFQFGEYVEQRLASVADRLEADRDFWRTLMAGARPMALSPDLKRDWERKPSSGSFRVQVLDAEQATAMERWARKHRTTMFAALFTGFSLAMADRLDNRDVLVSTVFEQRDRPGTADMVGPFIHPALLRVPVPDGATWESLAPLVRDRVLDAYNRAHIPAIEVLGMHMDVLQEIAMSPAGLCVFQYIPAHVSEKPVPFGPATASVVPSEEGGPTGDVGLMFRLHRSPTGELTARVTFDERDLAEPLARELFEEFAARLAEPLAAGV